LLTLLDLLDKNIPGKSSTFAVVGERTPENRDEILAGRLLAFTAEINPHMASNQFENSRVSEGTLRAGSQAPQDVKAATTEPEISNMIAEGSPASPEPSITVTNLPKMRGLVAASTLSGYRVLKAGGEELGNIEEVMLDLKGGQIAYAVLSFSGFPGIGNKRFPVPWSALQIDPGEQAFVLDIDRQTLEGAPDFDKDNWPDMADPAFSRVLHKHYGTAPYWERTAADAGNSSRGEHPPASRYQPEMRH
jgi:sporulation protein YlmC with PRC-barrel domain